MSAPYTYDTIGEHAAERGLNTGDRLSVAGDSVNGAALRSGNSPENAAV